MKPVEVSWLGWDCGAVEVVQILQGTEVIPIVYSRKFPFRDYHITLNMLEERNPCYALTGYMTCIS